MENWQTALVVLAAVAVGVAIPVLVQLRATLRAVEKTLLTSGAKLDLALGATTAVAARVDALVARVEEGGRVDQLVEGVAAVSRLATQLRDTIRVASALGAAVGPAVAAAVQAFREDADAPAAPPTPLEVAQGEGEGETAAPAAKRQVAP